MTQESQLKKDFFNLGGGLNTEINELNFPDGFTRDEANYELLIDGSRRRRKGLRIENGAGAALVTDVWRTAEANQTFLWTNVGGDPNKKLVVYRKGETLSFADADEKVSDGWNTISGGYISTQDFHTTGATSANTLDVPLSFSQGRGYLFVTGPYIRPFYVEYDATANTFAAAVIDILIRDFADLEDSIHVGAEPGSTITADHKYNLRNRGWQDADMTSYFSAKAKHPAKNAVWHKGYIRTFVANVMEADGTRSWSNDKMDAEVFSNNSAPRGSLFLTPFDTTSGFSAASSGAGAVNISTWSYIDNGSNWTVTLTAASDPGIGVGVPFTITNNRMDYQGEVTWVSETYDGTTNFNGNHTSVAGTTGVTVKFTWNTPPADFFAWNNQYASLGVINGASGLVRSSGAAYTDSFDAIEFHAGRVFYAGMKNAEFADTILFSQIVDTPAKFGRCFQEADPTGENFNALTPADGGTIIVAGLGGVLDIVAVRNSLVVLGRDGVWEVSGGQRGVFTADGYSVRKLSSQGANAPDGWTRAEDNLIYTGPGGVFRVGPNQFTGQLEVTSVSERSIQTLWNQISDAKQQNVQIEYDSSLRRVYIMIGPDGATTMGITTMLIFDARVGGWFKYTFNALANNELLSGFAIPNADDTSQNKKMKFIYKASTTSVQVADFDQTSFNDWDGTNGPLPFLLTGHDQVGDWQSRKQAPIITVYSKRTETGYVDNGTGWDPTNESSTLMAARWDWSDDSVTNKVGAQQQVYRHTRQFIPAAADDVDGYPVVVTRNKVRGRGRALQLRFDGAANKDSHILGYTVNYKVSRKK